MPLPVQVETDPSYYGVLGISSNFFEVTLDPLDKLKKIYRVAALIKHPDKEGGETAAFQLLDRAYKTLKDDQQRLYYNDLRRRTEGRNRPNDDNDIVSTLERMNVYQTPEEKQNFYNFYHERLRVHQEKRNLTEEQLQALNQQLIQAVEVLSLKKVQTCLSSGAFPCVSVKWGRSSEGSIISKLLYDITHSAGRKVKEKLQDGVLEFLLDACINAVVDPLDFNIQSNLKMTVLNYAIVMGSLEVFKLLLEKGADPIVGFCLHEAVTQNNLDMFEYLMPIMCAHNQHVLGNDHNATPLNRAINKRFELEGDGESTLLERERNKTIMNRLFAAFIRTFSEKCDGRGSFDFTAVMREIKSEFNRLNNLPVETDRRRRLKNNDNLLAFERMTQAALMLVSIRDEDERVFEIQEIRKFIANQSKYSYRMVGVLLMLVGAALFIAGIPLSAILTFNYVIGVSSVTAVGASLFYYGQETQLLKALSKWMGTISVENKNKPVLVSASF